MASLYELTGSYREVMEMLLDDAHDEQTIIDTLDAIEDAIEDKAENYAKLIRQLEYDAKVIYEEESRLRARRMALESKRERLKSNLFDALKATGVGKIKTPLFTIGIQKNGGKRRVVLDVEAGMLPPYFRQVEYKVNTERLRESLEGAESNAWCHLDEQGESLRIR